MTDNHYKRVILCADDYGQNLSVSQAIVQLLQKKCLSAVSCMVTKSDWSSHWKNLQVFDKKIDVGLHFNLTEAPFLSQALKKRKKAWSLNNLLLMSQLGLLNTRHIQVELLAQLDCFIDTTGRLPDFIDGHQYIHHFKGIRKVLFDIYESRLKNSSCYLRSALDKTFWYGPSRFKRLGLLLSGAWAFDRALKKQNIPHNHSFSGIYPFSEAARYSAWCLEFFKKIKDGGLIVCHPGLGEFDFHDPIYRARGEEYRYLQSLFFKAAYEKAKIQWVRFGEIYSKIF